MADSMRDIRSRISSVQKTMKITNAMYLMASSKLKKARTALARTAPYFEKLQYVMIDILNHTDEGRQRYFATDREIPVEELKDCYIIITSDKGLAGAYNLNVCRLAESKMRSGHNNTMMFIGYKGHKYFVKHPELGKIDEEFIYSAATPGTWRARRFAECAVEKFIDGEYDRVFIVYTKMINALTSEAQLLQILPLTSDMFPVVPAEDSRTYSTEYAPSAIEVLDKVVPDFVKGMIYGATVEAFASEQNARMTAMQNATDNAAEIVSELSLQYNRVRQAAITTEINEVVAGANAQKT